MISNCGKDERDQYSGGKPGDQTGQEYCIRTWYNRPNRPWNYVLRYPDRKVAKTLARIAKDAAKNENIGYDQSQRGTYYVCLKAAGWEPSKIHQKCEADCSSSTAANVIATGHCVGVKALQNISPGLTTGSLRVALARAGFQIKTESKYTAGEEYLLPGDILLSEGHHVAINLTKGGKASFGALAERKAELKKEPKGKK